MATIQQGSVIILSQKLLPIHSDSCKYAAGAHVIPDGEEFLVVKTNLGDFAMHKKDSLSFIKAKDEVGDDVYVHRYLCSFVRAETKQGGHVYFTSERAAEVANYKYSVRKGTFIDKSVDDFYGTETLLSYHTSQGRIREKCKSYITDADEWLVGFEVEKTDVNLQRKGIAWQLLQDYGWSKETDGSLNSGGYELVSPILPLFKTDVVKSAVEPVQEFINAHSDSSCGGHITISNKNMTNVELLNLMKNAIPILYAIYPNRILNRYCQAKKFDVYIKIRDKYTAFYLKSSSSQKGGLIEIRLPSRVINADTLMWRLELLQTLLNECIAGKNLNQIAMKIGSPENKLYKLFRLQYSHESICEKLRLIHKYSIEYGTHRSGLSASVRERINKTMNSEIFPKNG